MNFIKKVFDEKIDELVHLQFQKFSKGEFRDRAIIEAKNSNGKYTVKTSAEFANEMVRAVAKKLGDKETNITGCIVSTNDLTGELDFKDKKQFQGVKKYMIDSEISGNKIIELLEKSPKAFFALSFSAANDGTILKIKPKAPKSGKPGSKGKEKPNFCKLSTNDPELGRSFVFERPNFKKAEITHHFIIEQIEIPEELKNSKDFEKIREGSKRKGKIIREAVIDGQDIISEKEFEA